jgi:ribosomal protein L37AE/L43A
MDKMEVRLICPKCGKTPEPDREKSNKNWNFYDPDCRHCGTTLKLEVVECKPKQRQ